MSESPETGENIEAAAADWVALLDREQTNPEIFAQFDAWAAADPRRYGAFVRARAGWRLLDRVRAHASLMPPATAVKAPRLIHLRLGPAGRLRRGLLAAAALALPLALGVGIALSSRETAYATGADEVRRVTLPDGTEMTLNTSSEVRARMGPVSRRVEMVTGEAWFEVPAAGSRRPFLLQADAALVRGGDARFLVRKGDSGFHFTVANGSVDAWALRRRSETVRLTAGDRARAEGLSVTSLKPVDAKVFERSLTWRAGAAVPAPAEGRQGG